MGGPPTPATIRSLDHIDLTRARAMAGRSTIYTTNACSGHRTPRESHCDSIGHLQILFYVHAQLLVSLIEGFLDRGVNLSFS